ncbi:MAG: hypothetical protein IBJ09_02225 [Bacteroidia bacterium]|nr:hypothetical protein [Bacteroidia bacterium]
MKLKLSAPFVLTFLALTFTMHEAHEIVHTSVGRLICGCWGQRDFNVWELCEGCSEQKPISVIATFAGPVFTYIMIGLGTVFIGRDKTNEQKAMGFSLIFANIPFARIVTAAMGGGDEVWGLHLLLKDRTLAWTAGLLIIIAITIIPLWRSYTLITNKWKAGWFLLFLIAPVVMDLLVVLGVMNTLLEKGIFATSWIAGSPILVTVWTFFVTGMFLLTRKNIYKLSQP